MCPLELLSSLWSTLALILHSMYSITRCCASCQLGSSAVALLPLHYHFASYHVGPCFASTTNSTNRSVLSKGCAIHSTTNSCALSTSSIGPSRMTSSWTCNQSHVLRRYRLPQTKCHKCFAFFLWFEASDLTPATV